MHLVEFATFTQHHAGTTDLAHAFIGDADHRHLGNRRMPDQRRFDFRRVAVETADDVHVLQAVGNDQVARLVQAPDIARVQPAFGVDGFAGRFGVLEIALHDVKATQADLAGKPGVQRLVVRVADAHFSAGNRPSAGAGDHLRRVLWIADRRQSAALGQAIGGGHHGKPQLIAHALDQARRDARRTGHRDTQARQVGLLELRMGQQRQVQRRCAGQDADTLTGDALEHLFCVEHRMGQDGRPADQAGQPTGLVAKGMKERVNDQVTVARHQADDLDVFAEGSQVLPMAAHHALGFAGGAGGEQQVAHGLGANSQCTVPGAVGIDGRRAAQELCKCQVHSQPGRVAIDNHQVFEAGRSMGREQRRVVDVEKPLLDKQQPAAAAFQHIGGLKALHARVDRHQHRTGALDAQRREDPVTTVRRPDTDPVTGLDPQGHQAPGKAHDALGQVRVVDALAVFLDGRAPGKTFGAAKDQLGKGDRGCAQGRGKVQALIHRGLGLINRESGYAVARWWARPDRPESSLRPGRPHPVHRCAAVRLRRFPGCTCTRRSHRHDRRWAG
ncbi:hypothetical protein D3C73_788820 [compost metagenome]